MWRIRDRTSGDQKQGLGVALFHGIPKPPLLVIVCDYPIAKGEEEEVFFLAICENPLNSPRKTKLSSEAHIQTHPIISH